MQNYRELLTNEYSQRLQRNRGYSRRAFARDLGLSPGHFSEIVRNKKKLSADKASEVVAKLNWTLKKKKLFLDLVRYELAGNEEHRKVIASEMLTSKKTKDYKLLQHQTFQMISNWYYHAFLALTETKDFRYDLNWISQKLDLPVETVKSALEVLLHLQLLEEKNGNLVQPSQMIRAESIPSRAIREHHRQFLEKAITSLETQDFNVRDITGSCFAINPEKLPEAKKLIKEFRENLAECLSEAGKNNQVYRLSVQLFRLDKDI